MGLFLRLETAPVDVLQFAELGFSDVLGLVGACDRLCDQDIRRKVHRVWLPFFVLQWAIGGTPQHSIAMKSVVISVRAWACHLVIASSDLASHPSRVSPRRESSSFSVSGHTCIA